MEERGMGFIENPLEGESDMIAEDKLKLTSIEIAIKEGRYEIELRENGDFHRCRRHGYEGFMPCPFPPPH